MTRDEAMRKAAALLRLAARGGTAAEAAAAAGKAQEILDRFELTREAVELAGQQKPEPEEDLADFSARTDGELVGQSRLDFWRMQLSSGLASMHGAFTFRSRRRKRQLDGTHVTITTLEIVGRPSAVETVRYLTAWLTGEVERLTTEHGRGMGGPWRREFAEGAVSEILTILRAKRKETIAAVRSENASNAIVLASVNHALARLDPEGAAKWANKKHKLVSGGSRGAVSSDPGAYASGRAAARTIDMGGGRVPLPGARQRTLPGR